MRGSLRPSPPPMKRRSSQSVHLFFFWALALPLRLCLRLRMRAFLVFFHLGVDAGVKVESASYIAVFFNMSCFSLSLVS